MKMFEDYDSGRDQSNKYYEHQDNALVSYLVSNDYYPGENEANNVDYLREFQGTYNSGIDSTANSKQLIFKTDPDEDAEDWKRRDPKDWTGNDVLHWIVSVAEMQKFPYEQVNASSFNVDGKTLLSLSRKEFESRDENYGPVLYGALHKSRTELEDIGALFQPPQNCKMELETLSTPAKIPDVLLPLTSSNLKQSSIPYGGLRIPDGFHGELADAPESYPFDLDAAAAAMDKGKFNGSHVTAAININNNSDSNVDSIGSTESERKNSTDNSLSSDVEHSASEGKKKKKKAGKRPPGRPPGVKVRKDKPEKKTGRLWEFIRDLLHDPQHCPSVICWENHDDGVFRFVKSEKVAKIWGDRKGNVKMNYEKLSRAMRYYYRSKVLQPVIGRRLVYKFGPTARGWKTENPNFRH